MLYADNFSTIKRYPEIPKYALDLAFCYLKNNELSKAEIVLQNYGHKDEFKFLQILAMFLYENEEYDKCEVF